MDWEVVARLSHTDTELGPIDSGIDRDGRPVPTMAYGAAAGDGEARRTLALWQELPEHPALLRAIDVSGSRVLLRYSPILGDFRYVESEHALTRLGAQLADLYRTLLSAVGEAEIGRLSAPFVKRDLTGQPRIGFEAVAGWTARMAPETKKTWPRCDERALVYLVGEIVADQDRLRRDRALWKVIKRCRRRNPDRRYQTLDEVQEAFANVGPGERPATVVDAAAWRRVEEGIGWLELGQPVRAREMFDGARFHDMYGDIVRTCDQLARNHIRQYIGEKPSLPWASAEPEALRLEATGDLAGALQTYRSVILDDTNQSAVFGAQARVHLARGEADTAIEYARRSIAADGARAETRAVLVRALLARGAYRDALEAVDALLLCAPGDATYQYLRGKVLFALGRLDDARAAFDLACAQQPTLLEAMLLRREVDRRIATGRGQVGSQGPISLDIPPSLAELREVLLGGSTSEAIAELSEPRLADNPDAQLVLAHMLAFDRQLERAAEIYDRVASMSGPHRHRARVGKATVLLDQGKLEPALAMFERLCAEAPGDLDASEGRARALERLGRTDEATAEYRRFLALATARSDVRVRVAEQWLDEHR